MQTIVYYSVDVVCSFVDLNSLLGIQNVLIKLK